MTSIATKRRFAAAALSVVVFVGLSGCGLSSRGQEPAQKRSISDVIADLKAIPGVTDAQFTGGSTGMPGKVQIGAGVSLKSGYTGNASALLDYVLQEVWSQGEQRPTTDVTLGISRGTGSDAVFLDLATAARSLGLDDVGTRIFTVDVDQMTKKYGPWPGKVPSLPADLATPSASPTP